jgi:hypothetical protein
MGGALYTAAAEGAEGVTMPTDDDVQGPERHLYTCSDCNRDWQYRFTVRTEHGALCCPGCGHVFTEGDLRRDWGIAFEHMRRQGIIE